MTKDNEEIKFKTAYACITREGADKLLKHLEDNGFLKPRQARNITAAIREDLQSIQTMYSTDF